MPPRHGRGQLFGVSCSALLDSALPADECRELFDRDTGLADQDPECALCDFAVIGDGEAAERGLRMPQDDVAPLLAVDFVSEPAKGRHGLAAGDSREGAQTATSMTSS